MFRHYYAILKEFLRKCSKLGKLWSTVNTDNKIEEEIKERIALGNKAFFANKKIFQSKLISKNAKLKLYFSVIRPVVTYACETWILKETITNRLMVFERKILRKIFGPTYENRSWRIKTNEELDKLIKHENIINFARVQRLGWYGRIERMQDTRMVKAIHAWKPISKRPMGRPKIHWEDDVKKDIQKLKVPNWKTLVQKRGRWKWVGRPKLRTKSCRAILRRRRRTGTHLFYVSPVSLTCLHACNLPSFMYLLLLTLMFRFITCQFLSFHKYECRGLARKQATLKVSQLIKLIYLETDTNNAEAQIKASHLILTWFLLMSWRYRRRTSLKVGHSLLWAAYWSINRGTYLF